MNRSSDPASLNRRLARPMMTRNQQHDPLTPRDRIFEGPVDRRPGAIQVHSMEVEHSIGLDRATTQSPIPASVERFLRDWHRLGPRDRLLFRCPRGYRPNRGDGRFLNGLKIAR